MHDVEEDTVSFARAWGWEGRGRTPDAGAGTGRTRGPQGQR